ncbi:MAG: hypothetical protein QG650_271 [Patescibacteria group bacterium]|nr:hypothetical protein [Patescibacteria group bacterium]
MSLLNTGVWEKKGGSGTMSRSSFYGAVGLILAWGLGVSGYMAQEFSTAQFSGGQALMLCLLPFVGIFMAMGGAVLSAIGYHLVVIPFGMLLGPVLAHFEIAHPGIVYNAAYMTGSITLIMGVSGFLFPDFYRRIGGALFVALLGLVIIRVVQIFLPFEFGLLEYFAAGLFSLYIGFDMWRASEIEPTMDNAVDIALSLYLDILNLSSSF